ncbi:Ribosomal protein L29 [Corchorus capsularis]|uniref:Ribosomal protein L29 n=1 Tax=Corchorus capsularis TaxID=210143 RepID=A0A1R3HQ03_COCAP|nr:Ribosomal protein L29 [Corchorus capsularis]
MVKARIKIQELRKKSETVLLSQLKELKAKLALLRVAKVTGSKIKVARLSVAKVSRVISQKQKVMADNLSDNVQKYNTVF